MAEETELQHAMVASQAELRLPCPACLPAWLSPQLLGGLLKAKSSMSICKKKSFAPIQGMSRTLPKWIGKFLATGEDREGRTAGHGSPLRQAPQAAGSPRSVPHLRANLVMVKLSRFPIR